MGSVRQDYKCPLCGRVGNGGYSPDNVGFPICTPGPHNCLDKATSDITPVGIIRDALEAVLSGRIDCPATCIALRQPVVVTEISKMVMPKLG